MVLAPRAKWDRLFCYPGGIAQRLAAEPEPKILRWADVTAATGRGAKSWRRSWLKPSAMAIELMPGLIEAYGRGQPIVLGELTISQPGLSYQPRRAGTDPWQLAWPDVRAVQAYGPGRGVRVSRRPRIRGNRWINLDGVPNGVLAHHVIEHAAPPDTRGAEAGVIAQDGQRGPSGAGANLSS